MGIFAPRTRFVGLLFAERDGAAYFFAGQASLVFTQRQLRIHWWYEVAISLYQPAPKRASSPKVAL